MSEPSGAPQPSATARFLLGAAGWEHPQWPGAFYPEELPADWRLAYYAHFFGCVLVPRGAWEGAAPAQWLADTPAQFRFLLEDGPGVEAVQGALGARCAGVVEAGGGLRGGAGGELLFLDAAGDLRGLARRLRKPRPGGAEVYLVDREGDLRRLREAATLLGLLGLACGPGLV